MKILSVIPACEGISKAAATFEKSGISTPVSQVHPVYLPSYFFAKHLQKRLQDDSIIVLGNSTIAAHILQIGIEKEKQRIINNMNCGSMGYDLPAVIGAAVAAKKTVTLITGDGSFMLNIQELMTMKHYNLPIKLFISCNGD